MSHKKQELNQEKEQKQEENCKCDQNAKECNCKDENHEHECGCKENDCKCEGNCDCKEVKNDLAEEYLNMARVIQADFDNYRKRTAENIKQAKKDGMISALEVILPCLDVFKKAKQMITNENDKKGIEMVENEINNSLNTLGVEKINTQNAKFDPNLHHALSIVEDKTKPDNIIVDEYQAGYKLGDKVIKYSQVIVNKLKEEK